MQGEKGKKREKMLDLKIDNGTKSGRSMIVLSGGELQLRVRCRCEDIASDE